MPRREGQQDRATMPRREGRQDGGIMPRGEGRRDRATMPRSEGRQERAAGQNSGTWPNRGRRQYAAEAGLAQQWGGTRPGSPAMRRGAQQYRTEQRYRGPARQSRRQRVLMQRLILGAWIVCILLFAVYFAIKNKQARSAGEGALPVSGEQQGDAANGQPSGTLVQGIPADAFARHPDWTEDFLTPAPAPHRTAATSSGRRTLMRPASAPISSSATRGRLSSACPWMKSPTPS